MSQQEAEVEEVSGVLPTRPRPGYVALYRFLNRAGELLYVGICDEPVKRWYAHADKPWWPEVALFRVRWHPSREEAAARETEAIRAERPRHNVVLNGVPYNGSQFPGPLVHQMTRERFGDRPFCIADLEDELGCPRGSARTHARRLQEEGLFEEVGTYPSEGRPRPRVHFRALPVGANGGHTEAPSAACDGE